MSQEQCCGTCVISSTKGKFVNEPISQVFLDMDGVLADFFTRALWLHDGEYHASSWPPGEWNMPTVLGITEDEFWRKVDEFADFWPGIDPYPWANELIKATEVFSGCKPKLLSTPSRHHSAYSGKRKWAQRYCQELELILCKSKYLLSAPGRLLIDDKDTTIDKWREAGGEGILFPRPWNALHARSGMAMVHVGMELAKFSGAEVAA